MASRFFGEKMIRFIAGIVASLWLCAAVFAQQLPDFTGLVESQGPAVVNISATQAARRAGQIPQIDENDPFYEFFRRFAPNPGPRGAPAPSLGSGFIIATDGYILTNAHVVDAADEVTVRLNDKREFKAKVIGSDKRTDVALLKIDAAALPVVRFGDPGKLKVGEWVVAIGSPFGFDNTVTAGIVSAKGRSLPQENFVPFIQTDVAVNPGNSGGPLFNLRGEVVGINSQIYSRTGGFMGLSFAIPIDVAQDIARQLRTSGKVTRGRIGVVIQPLTKELADGFGLAKSEGALVNSVEKGGPAEKAGVMAGDVILKFDGKAVGSSEDLPRIVGNTRPGSAVGIQVWRDKSARNLQVTVGELKDDGLRQARRSGGPAEAETGPLGLALSDLSESQRRELKVEAGVRVDRVQGAAASAGVRRGDVIVAVNSQEVSSVDQFRSLMDGFDKGRIVAILVRRGGNSVYIPFRIPGNG